jgi:serine/threonine protein kinase
MQLDDDQTRTYVPLTKDTLVSHYRIIEKIGAGGMGEVYLAEDTELSRKVALKFLPLHLCQDADCRTRFKREAQAAAKLNHPNIVTIHEVSEFNGRPFIAMEHVDGRSLKEYGACSVATIRNVIELSLQICDGLASAHEAGVVHRDIKPSNILVDTHGRARIVDFGLAAVKGSEPLTKTGSTLGTIGYMSPEQVHGQQTDSRSDLFSFGVILYELVTDRSPFKADTEAATIKNIVDATPEPLARYKSDVPEGLQRIVSKLLAKSESTRYQHADDVGADMRTLLTDLGSTRPGMGLPAKERRISIAVLPFMNMSPDKENEYFSDGMTEDIIAQLAKISNLRVISRTSIMRYKHSEKSIREIGLELNVTTILEGSVRKTADRVRIVCQLIDADTDEHIWAETYDRQLKDVFEIQSDVAQRIANALKVAVLPSEHEKLQKVPISNLEAYNSYLRGRFHWNKRTEEGLHRAIECFSRSIELDAKHAPAYAGLADSYSLLPWYGHWLPKDAAGKARDAALKAIALDVSLGEAYASLGIIEFWYGFNWSAGESHLRRSIQLTPNYATAHQWLGFCLCSEGSFDEGFLELKHALDLDPLSHIINNNLGDALYLRRQFDEAISQYHLTLDINADVSHIHRGLGKAYLMKGMYDQAASELQKAGTGELVRALYLLDRVNEAHAVAAEIADKAGHGLANSVDLALAHVGLGEYEQALQDFEKAREEGWPWLMENLKLDPYLDPLRSDPRFLQLMERCAT